MRILTQALVPAHTGILQNLKTAHLMIALNQIITATWGTKDKTQASSLIKMINEFWREKRKPSKKEKKKQSLKAKKLSLTLAAFFRNDYIMSIIITMGRIAMITIMVMATKKNLQASFTATITTMTSLRKLRLVPK